MLVGCLGGRDEKEYAWVVELRNIYGCTQYCARKTPIKYFHPCAGNYHKTRAPSSCVLASSSRQRANEEEGCRKRQAKHILQGIPCFRFIFFNIYVAAYRLVFSSSSTPQRVLITIVLLHVLWVTPHEYGDGAQRRALPHLISFCIISFNIQIHFLALSSNLFIPIQPHYPFKNTILPSQSSSLVKQIDRKEAYSMTWICSDNDKGSWLFLLKLMWRNFKIKFKWATASLIQEKGFWREMHKGKEALGHP